MNQRGFSLLELLIYIAVLAIVTLVVVGVYLSIGKGRGKSGAQSEVNSAVRFAVEKIAQDLRSVASSSDIASPAAAGSSSSTLAVVVGGASINYATTSDGRLARSVNSAPEPVTPETVRIDSLNFTRIDNSNAVLGKTFVSVEVDISVSYRSDSPDWQYSASKKTTVGIRN